MAGLEIHWPYQIHESFFNSDKLLGLEDVFKPKLDS